MPGYRRTTVTPSPIRRSSAVPRSPASPWRHPRLPLHHLLHLLDDAIPSFIISCTSDFENSNNFLLPPGWRAKRGGERGGRGWPGLRGLVLPAVWRWFQVADAGAALSSCGVAVLVVVLVVVIVVVAVVVKVAVVVANRRCEGDEFRVYIKFGPHQ